MNKLRKIAATITLMALCVFNFTVSSMQAQAAAKEASETVDWYKTVYQLDPDVGIYSYSGEHIKGNYLKVSPNQNYSITFSINSKKDLKNLQLAIPEFPEMIEAYNHEFVEMVTAHRVSSGDKLRSRTHLTLTADEDMLLAVTPFLRIQTTEEPYYFNVLQSPSKGVKFDAVKQLPSRLLKKDGNLSVTIYFRTVPLSNWMNIQTDEDGFAVRDENGSPISGGSGI